MEENEELKLRGEILSWPRVWILQIEKSGSEIFSFGREKAEKRRGRRVL